MLRLSYYFATEEFEDGKPSSTLLIYFCNVLGMSADGSTFDRPRNYTSHLSAVIYCVRLVLFESALPRFAHSGLEWKARPRRGQLDRLQPLRREKMCFGSQAPLGELISLRSYGRAVSRSDGPSTLFYWSEDGQTISWNGAERLSMTQFRQISHGALELTTSSCDRLMYGWRPPCRLDWVKDVLSEKAEGYSFVSDAKNGLSQAYLKLSERACLAAADGLITDSSRWDARAVKRYLELHDDMLQQLTLLIYLTAGQAPRGTELLCVEHRNGPSTLRGVYVHAGQMVIITRHHKARRATNNEFQVARYLPAEVGAIVYRYLVFIRPFVDMLCRECRGRNLDTSLLFAGHARPSELWKTDHLTKALQQQTMNTVSVSMGVRVYRQLSIAITVKHVKQIWEPFNRYDDESKDADVSVAFDWQGGHRPMTRGTIYGLDGAFPDSLQPELLRRYEWVSYEWHRFLRLERKSLEAVRKRKERSMTLLPAPSPKRCVVEISSESDVSGVGDDLRAAEEGGGAKSDGRQDGGQEGDDDEIRQWKEKELRRWKESVDRSRAATNPKPPTAAAADAIVDRLLYYDHAYKVLICKEHRYAMRNLDMHLRDQHAVGIAVRRIIVERYASLPVARPADVRLPPPFGPPCVALGLPVDGLLCKSCAFACAQPTSIRRHCNLTHGWRSTARGSTNWTAAKVQTFFSAGGLQRYFAVRALDGAGTRW